MNWNPFRPKQKLEIIRRSQSNLRLSEWRTDKALVSSAMRLLRDPDFQLMMDVLRNEHPGSLVHLDVDPPNRVVLQARAEGYTMALANVVALGRFEKMNEPLEATFDPEEIQTAD